MYYDDVVKWWIQLNIAFKTVAEEDVQKLKIMLY